MTDYLLACPDCGHDAGRHYDEGGCTDSGCQCVEGASDIYAAECARLDAELTRTAEDRIKAERERDAARAECDRYKAALELILKIDSYTAGAKDIARTALDADKEKDNG